MNANARPWRTPSRKPAPSIRAAAMLAAGLVAATLAPAPAAAQQPGLNEKHVCDWTFVSGPRAGTFGKESRTWLGSHPSYHSIAWWIDGSSGTVAMELSNPQTLSTSPAMTRWDAAFDADGQVVTSKAKIAVEPYLHQASKRVHFPLLSNGGVLDCLELGGPALEQIREAYWRAGAVCDCRGSFDYASTVGCIEGCAAWWDRDFIWFPGRAPECLEGPSVVRKAACLLSHDPRLQSQSCQLSPSQPGCPGHGPGPGEPCWAKGPLCEEGSYCDASKTCVEMGG